MNSEVNKTNIVGRILRLGIVGTYLGHGFLALKINEHWIPLMTSVGFSRQAAVAIMPAIGIVDIAVAICIFIRPLPILLVWATLWAFAAGFTRITAGESIWEFVERFAEWGIPLALLVYNGVPKTVNAFFHFFPEKKII
jgi:hypothetical protein